jgi:hypothetical protein
MLVNRESIQAGNIVKITWLQVCKLNKEVLIEIEIFVLLLGVIDSISLTIETYHVMSSKILYYLIKKDVEQSLRYYFDKDAIEDSTINLIYFLDTSSKNNHTMFNIRRIYQETKDFLLSMYHTEDGSATNSYLIIESI